MGRQTALAGIHGVGAIDFHHSELRKSLHYPDFFFRPGGGNGRQRQGLGRPGMTADQLQLPVARAYLQPQTTVGHQPGRQGAVQRQRYLIFKQHRSQLQLPGLAGHFQLNVSIHLQGDVVGNMTIDGHVQGIGCGGLSLVAPAGPQPALFIQLRLSHRLAVYTQCQQSCARVELQADRHAGPLPDTVDAVLSCWQRQHRLAVALPQQGRHAVYHYLLWPVLTVAGQRDIGVIIQFPALLKTPFLVI